MRTITYLGLGLLVCGALVLVASSGAFDTMSADRGVGIDTAPDEDALLGLEYDETHQLVSTNGEGSCSIFPWECGYEYADEELLHLEDNTADRDLDIWLKDGTTSDTEIIDDISLNEETATVEGSFQCPTEADTILIFPIPGDQEEASETATIAIAGSNDDVTIELERDVTVQCQED